MRITHSALILACLLLGAVHPAAAAQSKYGVTVRTSKATELAKVKTYTWTVSQPSYDKTVDRLIIAAVDRELAARGMTKLPSGRGDAVVTYRSVSRTNVDVKEAKKDNAPSGVTVGTLVVEVTSAANQPLFLVRMDTPIALNSATIETAINGAVAAMFEKYPPTPKQ